ncbi:methionine synthase reductase isoform X1 [Polypterus senegalus]
MRLLLQWSGLRSNTRSSFVMPCASQTRFLLLYGSQRGQAKAIAEEIAVKASDHGFAAEVSCLSEEEKYNLERERSPVVIVVSTTGDGEPPDTAINFVKKIKTKTLCSVHFAHLHYALLGLGDSNYSNFCNCGKTIDKRLGELGAQQFYASGYADDGVGLELVVEPWIEGLWDALRKFVTSAMSTSQKDTNNHVGDHNAKNEMRTIESAVTDLNLHLLSLDESSSKDESGGSCNIVAEGEVLEASLTRSVSPLSESSLNVPALPAPFLDVELLNELQQDPTLLKPPETAHQVVITSAKQLTREDAVKTTLLLEMDISETPLVYEPGDSFDLLCPNNNSEVEELLLRLGILEKKHHIVKLQVKPDTKRKVSRLPLYIPEHSSLQYIFMWCLEIRAIPKKAFLRSLVEYTTNEHEKRRLQELCSKQGFADYNHFIRNPSLSILDLLCAFPSCMPTLSVILEHLPKLQPRSYSAASSIYSNPGRVHIVFNIVEFPPCPERPALRKGVCTGWLSNLVLPILQHSGGQMMLPEIQDASNVLPKVYICSRPSSAFHLPSDTAAPIIMVGPGTGISPFIGFLQHRKKQREEHPDVSFGETWLFFGCRHKDRDFIFRDELGRFQAEGTLTHLRVSFSRDQDDSTEEVKPKYVQDNLRLNAQDVVRVLFKENGYIYICGDAKNMAKNVHEELIDIFSRELQIDKLEAMKVIADLREKKRYLQDIWS